MSQAVHMNPDHARVGMSVSQSVLLIPVQVELHDDVLVALQHDALLRIQQQNLNRLLLDLSQVPIMDQHIAASLAQLFRMASLLGATCVVTGVQPGVAVSLTEWHDIWQGMHTALTLDAGLQWLQHGN